MKYKKFLKREAINWLFILMPFIYIFLVYDKLPRFAPFQLKYSEQIVYYQIFFLMGVSNVWYLILLVKPSIVPKTTFQENLKSHHRIKTNMLGFTSLLSLTFISQEIGITFNLSKTVFILTMIYIIVLGNFYPTMRFNYFFGFKNSWTKSNELIWKKTHRFAGRIFFLGGLIGALYGILFNVNHLPYMPVILVGYVFSLSFAARIYSYLLYRQFQSQNQG